MVLIGRLQKWGDIPWKPTLVRDMDGATRMTLRNRGEPVGFAKVGAKALAAAMRRANQKDLDNLRAIFEKRPG